MGLFYVADTNVAELVFSLINPPSPATFSWPIFFISTGDFYPLCSPVQCIDGLQQWEAGCLPTVSGGELGSQAGEEEFSRKLKNQWKRDALKDGWVLLQIHDGKWGLLLKHWYGKTSWELDWFVLLLLWGAPSSTSPWMCWWCFVSIKNEAKQNTHLCKDQCWNL